MANNWDQFDGNQASFDPGMFNTFLWPPLTFPFPNFVDPTLQAFPPQQQPLGNAESMDVDYDHGKQVLAMEQSTSDGTSIGATSSDEATQADAPQGRAAFLRARLLAERDSRERTVTPKGITAPTPIKQQTVPEATVKREQELSAEVDALITDVKDNCALEQPPINHGVRSRALEAPKSRPEAQIKKHNTQMAAMKPSAQRTPAPSAPSNASFPLIPGATKAEISEWLEITSFHDKEYREKKLDRYRKMKALQLEQERLAKEEQMEAEERLGLSRHLAPEPGPQIEKTSAPSTLAPESRSRTARGDNRSRTEAFHSRSYNTDSSEPGEIRERSDYGRTQYDHYSGRRRSRSPGDKYQRRSSHRRPDSSPLSPPPVALGPRGNYIGKNFDPNFKYTYRPFEKRY